MINAARKAGRGLIRDFGEVEHLQVSQKGTSDFVSSADIKTEKLLRQELEKARPAFGFLGEESGSYEGSDASHRWIIDPIDGTTNFLHGIPHFAISIGLERDGEIIAGVVYEPIHDELYHAEKGGGTFLNDRRLRVSGRRKMNESLFATGIPFAGKEGHQDFVDTVTKVMAVSSGIRRFGAASLDLAFVAAGRYEGYWESNIKAWDIAAGIILVKEAGGYVSDRAGGSAMLGRGDIVAANSQLHETLLDMVRVPA
jgi:myo-inositol-1(or 4)-monophosphatase